MKPHGRRPAVKLIRGSWLLKRQEAPPGEATRSGPSWGMPRRQELERDEPDALLSPEEAAAMPRGYNGRFCAAST